LHTARGHLSQSKSTAAEANTEYTFAVVCLFALDDLALLDVVVGFFVPGREDGQRHGGRGAEQPHERANQLVLHEPEWRESASSVYSRAQLDLHSPQKLLN
jgi:hypothetical protein